MGIRIVTDSTSNITQVEARNLGIEVIPLNIIFEERTYKDDVELSAEEFYQKLVSSKKFPSTSQPSPEDFVKVFQDAKEKQDSVIMIVLSSKISGTYQFANAAKDMVEYDDISIIDSESTIMGLRLLVEEALKLKMEQKSKEEIVAHIENIKNKIRIFGIVDTLEYLHKCGRLSRTSAIIGGIFNIKPILKMQNGVLEVVGKERGSSSAIKTLLSFIENNPIDFSKNIYFGYTFGKNKLEKLIDVFKETYKDFKINENNYKIVSGVVGAHIGPEDCVVTYIEK